MIRRLLVPLDGSRFSEAVLPWLQRFLAGSGAEVHLLFVVTPTAVVTTSAFGGIETLPAGEEARMVTGARDYLDGRARALRRAATVGTLVRRGRPAAEIVEVAHELHVDAIAMATHGRSGVSGLILGSVAAEVVRQSGLPVLLIRPAAGEGARLSARAGGGRRAG